MRCSLTFLHHPASRREGWNYENHSCHCLSRRMNRISRTALVLIALLLSLLPACSKKDKVISVEDDDPAMTAAIAKARETLPQFWEVFEKREHGETDFALKVRITDKKGTEHF